ncbi:MAG: hypothetical protein M5U21_05400 [Fimbriimonadaceae bacterium]|nr:hypothetical protein [Fimbriimonadaceae bacterium]
MAKLLPTLLLTLLVTGCQTSPKMAYDSPTTWSKVLESWRARRDGSVTVRGQKVLPTKTDIVFTYVGTWTSEGLSVEVVVDKSRSAMCISPKFFAEGSKWCTVTDPAKEGEPNLLNLFGWLSDPVSPFGITAQPPTSSKASGTAYTYTWSLLGGVVDRDVELTVRSDNLLPLSVKISDVGSPEYLLVKYDFSEKSLAQINRGAVMLGPRTWNSALAGSETLRLLHRGYGRGMPSGPGAPDALVGGVDHWSAGYDVKTLTWNELRNAADFISLPSAWGVATSIQTKEYLNPGTGDSIVEFRGLFHLNKSAVRFTVRRDALATLLYANDKQVGQEVEVGRGKTICYYAGGENVPTAVSWLDGGGRLYIQLESVKASKKQLVEMAKLWFSRRDN